MSRTGGVTEHVSGSAGASPRAWRRDFDDSVRAAGPAAPPYPLAPSPSLFVSFVLFVVRLTPST